MSDPSKHPEKTKANPARRSRARSARAIKQAFLQVLPEAVTITASAAAIGVEKTKIYRLMREDGDFLKAVEDGIFEGRWAAREEAFRRAVDGVAEPVVQGGKIVEILNPVTGKLQPLTIRRYSDLLLRDFLRAGWPEQFKTNVHAELSGPNGKPIALQAHRPPELDLSQLSFQELQDLDRLMTKAQPLMLPAPAPKPEDEEPEGEPH